MGAMRMDGGVRWTTCLLWATASITETWALVLWSLLLRRSGFGLDSLWPAKLRVMFIIPDGRRRTREQRTRDEHVRLRFGALADALRARPSDLAWSDWVLSSYMIVLSMCKRFANVRCSSSTLEAMSTSARLTRTISQIDST